jgi:hypothetical protein
MEIDNLKVEKVKNKMLKPQYIYKNTYDGFIKIVAKNIGRMGVGKVHEDYAWVLPDIMEVEDLYISESPIPKDDVFSAKAEDLKIELGYVSMRKRFIIYAKDPITERGSKRRIIGKFKDRIHRDRMLKLIYLKDKMMGKVHDRNTLAFGADYAQMEAAAIAMGKAGATASSVTHALAQMAGGFAPLILDSLEGLLNGKNNNK